MPKTPALFGCLRNKRLVANVICCAPCMVGRQCNAFEGERNSMSVMHCVGACIGLQTWCVCCLRRKASEKYGLDENPIVSCAIAHCFCCCSLVQTQKILRRNGARPGMMLKPPSMKGMKDDDKKNHQEGKRKRREERRRRNEERRSRRKGNKDDGSSSESDSSDSE